MKTLDKKNDAVLKFGDCNSLRNFLDRKPSFVHIYEHLSGYEIRANIGSPVKFLGLMKGLNVEVFFENA